jgi:hypothetical protein
MSKLYKILTAGTLDELDAVVTIHLASGYECTGGPFDSTRFTPPNVSISQALVERRGPGRPPGAKNMKNREAA